MAFQLKCCPSQPQIRCPIYTRNRILYALDLFNGGCIMKFQLLITIAAVLCGGCVGTGPRVLGKTMPKYVVCPAADTKKCVQSVANTVPIWINKPQRFLVLNQDGSARYWGYLGRELTRDASQVVNFCGNSFEVNPLEKFAATNPGYDVIVPPLVSNTFTFNRKAETVAAASLNVDIDAALTAAAIPTGTGRAQAEAALRAAVKRVKKSELTLKGEYGFITVSPALIASLKANDTPSDLKNCAAFLKTSQTSLITSLTGVKIDTLTTAGSLASDASAGFDADLKDVLTATQIAALKAEFTKRVEQSWSVEFKPTYQVLSISGFKSI